MQLDNHLLVAAMLTAQMVRLLVWSGLVAATVTLLVLMRTRWGQSQPLRKCIVLSTLVHLLFGIYTTTVNIVVAIGNGNGETPMWVAIDDGSQRDGDPNGDHDDGGLSDDKNAPWNGFGDDATSTINERLAAPRLRDDLLNDVPNKLPDGAASPLEKIATRGSKPDDHPAPNSAIKTAPDKLANAAPIDAPRASRTNDPAPSSVIDKVPLPNRYSSDRMVDPTEFGPTDFPRDPLDKTAAMKPPRFDSDELGPQGPAGADQIVVRPASAGVGAAGDGDDGPLVPIARNNARLSGGSGKAELPDVMAGRMGNDRLRRVIANGGSLNTEAAVVAALMWLKEHQSQDGRWDADRYEAGREVMVNGHDRRGAGSRADTGVTGLALLAFLAHGNTHSKGEHPTTVQRGLEWLLSIQAADGNLGGEATVFERMYCHAMATCAISEAYAMSGDDRLAAPVRQAIGFCLKSQDKNGGGWRYQPGDPGDTSQLGWQVMALKSAELAGIEIPAESRASMVRFLKSVSSGKAGGLASYKPGHRATHTMTAEALVCRQFLGMARENPAADEAGDFVLSDLPGQNPDNVYYWYYGTLGMFQLQGDHWRQWNKALQDSLLKTQRTDTGDRGSWDPDDVWGAYGGRVYSTALSALCLEVYYRFLPLYVEAASREKRTN